MSMTLPWLHMNVSMAKVIFQAPDQLLTAPPEAFIVLLFDCLSGVWLSMSGKSPETDLHFFFFFFRLPSILSAGAAWCT